MPSFAEVVEGAIRNRIEFQLQSDARARIQAIVCGPPNPMLTELVSALTAGGASDWVIRAPAGPVAVPVLRVCTSPEARNVGATGKECVWDYAVNARNSYQCLLVVVELGAWGKRQESIRTATETLCAPTTLEDPAEVGSSWLLEEVCRALAARAAIPLSSLRLGIAEHARRAEQVPAADRASIPWEVLKALHESLDAGEGGAESLLRACGLPEAGGLALVDAIRQGGKALEAMGDLLTAKGLAAGLRELRASPAGIALASALGGLETHLAQSARSGSAFSASPCQCYRPLTASPPNWWRQLTTPALQSLLEPSGASTVQVRLKMECTNSLNQTSRARGEPVIVLDKVEASVVTTAPGGFTALAVSRRVGRLSPAAVPVVALNGSTATIQDLPTSHPKALRYVAEDGSAKSKAMDVVSLSTFEPKGLLAGASVTTLSLPRLDEAGRWRQEVCVASSGRQPFQIYCSPTVRQLDATLGGVQTAASVSNGSASIALDVEEELEVEFRLRDAAGQEIGSISIAFRVEESVAEAPRSRFESLVLAHQGGRNRPTRVVTIDNPLRQVEQLLIHSGDSWKPILAGGEVPRGRVSIDWGDPRLGAVVPEMDPRVPNPAGAPAALVKARDEVRRLLIAESRPLPEVDLASPGLEPAILSYGEEYLAWMRQAPALAVWFDCMAVLEPEDNPAAGHMTSSGIPIAVVLNPLHPLRLLWHHNAQGLLASTLRNTCPLAGFLDPHRCPDIGSWPVFRGGPEPKWETYVALPCDDVNWGLLWNAAHLKAIGPSKAAGFLAALGLGVRGLEGGFGAGHARRALTEVSRLKATKSVLRLAIAGDKSGASACSDGVMAWARENMGGPSSRWPLGFDVYDRREPRFQPAGEVIANLAEDTSNRVRWFDATRPPTEPRQGQPVLDSCILDQLGFRDPSLGRWNFTSPCSAGGLLRIRLRKDLNNATMIHESRLGSSPGGSGGATATVSELINLFERLSEEAGSGSRLEFGPNHRAVDFHLQSADMVSVSSAEIDPACFARGARGHGAFLWDYELPIGHGVAEQRAGFYLLAKPSESMKLTVAKAIALLGGSDEDVEALLDETSRRGIPVLKNLAAGGSHSRGEVGVFVASRLLQDTFGKVRATPRLEVFVQNRIVLLVPVDPFHKVFDATRARLQGPDCSKERPDLLIFCISFGETEADVSIGVCPLEVKFRTNVVGDSQLAEFLGQAAGFSTFLSEAWEKPPQSKLWDLCGKGLLASVLDYAFRIYADPKVTCMTSDEWLRHHQRVLWSVLSGNAGVRVVSEGRLLVFDSSPTSDARDLDSDGTKETLVIARADASSALARSAMSEVAEQSIRQWLPNACATIGGGLVPPIRPPDMEPGGPGTEQAPSPAVAAAGAGDTQGPAQEAPIFDAAGNAANERTESARAHAVPGGGAQGRVVPPEVRVRVAESFGGFVGNQEAVDAMSRDLLRALIEHPPHLPKTYLFVGNPSTGKTELAQRVARALDLPFVRIDGTSVKTREKLFELVDAELQSRRLAPREEGSQYGRRILRYPPLIVFVDEVHLVAKPVQESLLTLLEQNDRRVVLEDRVALMPQATFLFATTRGSEMDSALRSRCSQLDLRDYTEEEVARILGTAHPEWPDAVRLRIARYGRSVPRIAKAIARDLESEQIVSPHPGRTLEEHLEAVRRSRAIDENGLGRTDLKYLELLEHQVVGEKSLLNMLGSVDKETILSEVEPHLIERMKLVQKTPRGRELTLAGKRYLAKWRASAG